MNKDVLNQLPIEEQPIASKLDSVVENIQLSQSFQWELETLLMYRAKTTRPAQNLFTKIMTPVGWAITTICAIALANWAIRSLVPAQPSTGTTPIPQASFEEQVRRGEICGGPLALAHGFDVFLTNPDKTSFATLDAGKAIGELRSFAWSPDGRQLAIVGNTTGRGNIYLTNSTGNPLQPVLTDSELGYLMGASWSQDGNLLVIWSLQNNKVVYLLMTNGIGFVERDLPVQIFETPQFTPGHESIMFYGADPSLGEGLFQTMLNSSRTTNSSQTAMISDLVEDEGSFAWSPDGLHLAYVEMDRGLGKANLVVQSRIDPSDKAIIASIPIPKGSGSSLPNSANLSWASDGKSLVFDFGRGAYDRTVYLAPADGSGLIKVVASAYAPTISSDGKCLAYISNQQVSLLDLTSVSSASTTAPVVLADLPAGNAISDYRLDKLQWKP